MDKLQLEAQDKLRLFERILNTPEKVTLTELIDFCHSLSKFQLLLGLLTFFPAAYFRTIGLDTLFNVLVPLRGVMHTMGASDDKDRLVMEISAAYWMISTIMGWLLLVYHLDFFHFPVLAFKSVVALAMCLSFARLFMALQDTHIKKQRFYLNVAVQNKEEAVHATAKAKVNLPVLGTLAGKVANSVMSDEKFLTMVGEKMEQNVPEKMSLKSGGAVKGKAEVLLKKGNIIVAVVTVEAIDIPALVQFKAGDEKASKVEAFLDMLPKRVRTEIRAFMRSLIAKGLVEKMPEGMMEEMKEVAGLVVHVDAKRPDEQADFMFALLAALED